MRCPACQYENPAGQKFCGDCAARLSAICPSCRASNPAGQKFCGECGTVLGQGATAGRFAAPEAYTPKHLAERILTSKAALEGERKQVTVLFADMKGSMELLGDRDPEEARKLLDPVLERMMEAVHRYEGTVNQVMGDGIMALFGAPLAHEDHAVRACYAALRMQESVKKYADEVRRSHAAVVKMRVGLNSGEVVVRAIGSDLHMDYTAVGQTTHLAARMEQMADPGSVLITANTLDLAEGYLYVKPLGPIPVKGLIEPVEVYEVTGAGAVRTRLQASVARGLTRFVGRDPEIEQLRRTLERAGGGHGQVVAVIGEPGVGKSRLYYEFTRSHRTNGWLILESASVSYGKATTYLPVIDLFKTYFQIKSRDDSRKLREKISGKLVTLDETLLPMLPVFLALLDVPVDDPHWQALDPPQRRHRTLEACKRLLLRESQVQPLVLVFEDLHWIDSETQTVLDSLVASLPSARILLLVNYRPEYRHGWSSKSYYHQLQLDPLPPESAQEVLDALVGSDPGLSRLKRLLIERTEGNPFFLEESVRTLVETKALTGQRGAHHLARPVDTIQVPATVQAVLTARIDRVPAEEKRLLQSAAVIGHEVSFGLLQAVAELSDEELRRGLADLEAAEFIYETRLFPELEYTFKHALTHEVAYASLLTERRRAIHARIVSAIERIYAGRLTEQLERLAHHTLRGELWAEAAAYLRQAGKKALARSAHREAATWFEEALRAIRRLPEARDTMEQATDVRFDLRVALAPLGEYARYLNHLRDAASFATALGDQARLGRAFCYMIEGLGLSGDHDGAVESGQRSLAIAGERGDFGGQVLTTRYLGQEYYLLGDHRRAIELLRKSVAVLQGDVAREYFGAPVLTSVASRTYLVRCLSEVGEFAEALAVAHEATEIAEEVGQPVSLVFAYLGESVVCLHKGEFERAATWLQRGLRLVQDFDFSGLFLHIGSSLGECYVHLGRLAEGLPLLEQTVTREEARKRLGGQAQRACRLAKGYLAAGRIEDAVNAAGYALELSRQTKERGFEAWTLLLLAEIDSQRDPREAERAEAHYRQGVAFATELGMRPLVAHCHLGLGKLYRRTGKLEQAHEHFTTATMSHRTRTCSAGSSSERPASAMRI
jgi:class 3 adenylate cyclase/tetratricopeptide (TPR) repeat protein